MEANYLLKLSSKIQLEIKEEELPTYLSTFKKIEYLVNKLEKVKLGKNKMKRINTGYLKLSDLRKIYQKNIKSKSVIDMDKPILFKKIND